MSLPRRPVLDVTVPKESAITALSELDSIEIDRVAMPQSVLDLEKKSRSSRFPWRGQFSPELIEVLLTTYAEPYQTVVDPFVGSGTTLFEASSLNINSVGSEINPAAYIMSKTSEFCQFDSKTRMQYLDRLSVSIDKLWPYPLFRNSSNHDIESGNKSSALIQQLLAESASDAFVQNLAENLVLRLSDRIGEGADLEVREIRVHFGGLAKTICGLPTSNANSAVFLADARQVPIPANSADIVLTSPPYINVFNYHQNFRPAIELMGWDVLRVAKSEFGSNRKHRGNRFLTVVQYAIDMLAMLSEMRRVLRPGCRAIIVVGRESNVRGVRFENGRIVAALAVGSAGFRLVQRHERKFRNKFGKDIYEDVLHLIASEESPYIGSAFGRAVGEAVLANATSQTNDSDVLRDIEFAYQSAQVVQESPLFAAAHHLRPKVA